MRRLLAVCALAALGLLLWSPSAGAHALLRSSDPAEGAQLDRAPEVISITFTEAPERSLSTIRVLDATGTPHEAGRPEAVPGDAETLRIRVGPLERGVYTVTWRVVSRVDGHVTAGAFAFGVGVSPVGAPVPPAAATPKTPPPSALEIAGRWVLFLGLIALVGGAWVAAAAFGGTPAAVRRYAAAGWATGAAGVVLLGVAQWRSAGAALDAFAASAVGRAVIWRAAGVAAAGLALLVAARSRGRVRRVALWTAGLAAAGVMLAHVAAGHAAARGSMRAFKVAAQWGHFLAVGVWIGGLAALLLGVRGAPSQEKAAAVRRFSAVAGVALAVVAATGVLRAVNEVRGWGGLFSSGYGRVVLIKALLLVGLAGLGAVNRYRSVPEAATNLGRLRRLSRGELILAAATLAAAAVLSSISPPYELGRPAAAAGGAVVARGTDFATSVRARLEVSPGMAGLNRFVLRVTDFDSGALVRADSVSLRFTYLDDPSVAPSELDLRGAEDGTYTATASNLSLDGRWRVIALVQRGGSSVQVTLEVATRCRTTAAPGGPGQPTLYASEVPGGLSVQMYVDPGRAGLNEVHATFFDRTGTELDVSGTPTITATRAGRAPTRFEVRRFGAGHFVADARLEVADWRFNVAGASDDGQALRACFEQTIAP